MFLLDNPALILVVEQNGQFLCNRKAKANLRVIIYVRNFILASFKSKCLIFSFQKLLRKMLPMNEVAIHSYSPLILL